MKKQNGVSLITLVITIVLLLMLVGMAIQTSSDIPDEANFSKYKQDIKNVQVGIDNQKIKNARFGSDEETLTEGCIKIYLENEPNNFKSFGENDEPTRGYLVDLEKINLTDTNYGKDYNKILEDQTLTFGNKDTDVFVFDANYKVFYLPGLNYEGSMNYSL